MAASPPTSEPADPQAAQEWLAAEYFDGRTSRAHLVRARVAGEQLLIAGSGVARSVPLSQIDWPAAMRTRGGAGTRVAHLRDGGALHCSDAGLWDAWTRRHGIAQPLVARAQQSWAWTAGACALLLGLVAAMYAWGLPLAMRGVLAVTPLSVDRAVGQAALSSLEQSLLAPTALAPVQRERVRAAFAEALHAAYPAGPPVSYELQFHAGQGERLGPNAFALPGGVIVLSDELVQLAAGDEAIWVGVLAHEFGHLRHRHGMQLMGRGAAIGLAASVALGDVSSLVALAPVLLGQMAYSRELESQADVEAVHVLRKVGMSPLAMVRFFERLSAWRCTRGVAAAAPVSQPIDTAQRNEPGCAPPSFGLSSHPTDAQRIRFFREAAAQPTGG